MAVLMTCWACGNPDVEVDAGADCYCTACGELQDTSEVADD